MNPKIQEKIEERRKGAADALADAEALENAAPFLELLGEKAGMAISYVYGGKGYINLSLSETVKSFNDHRVKEALEGLSEIIPLEHWESTDDPEARQRMFKADIYQEETLITVKLRFNLSPDSTCEMKLLRVETRREHQWVEVEKSVPIYEVICPEEALDDIPV